jgi:hypothetical protein
MGSGQRIMWAAVSWGPLAHHETGAMFTDAIASSLASRCLLSGYSFNPVHGLVTISQMADVTTSPADGPTNILSAALQSIYSTLYPSGLTFYWIGGYKVSNGSWFWVDKTDPANINCTTPNCGIFWYGNPE